MIKSKLNIKEKEPILNKIVLKKIISENINFSKKNWYLYPIIVLIDILFIYLFFFNIFFYYELEITERISVIAEKSYDNLNEFSALEDLDKVMKEPMDFSKVIEEEQKLKDEAQKLANLAFQMFILMLAVFIIFQGLIYTILSKKINNQKVFFSFFLFSILSVIFFLSVLFIIYLTVRLSFANNISEFIRVPQILINLLFFVLLCSSFYLFFSWNRSLNILRTNLRESFFKFLLSPFRNIKVNGTLFLASIIIIFLGLVIYLLLFNSGYFFVSLFYVIFFFFPLIAFIRILSFRLFSQK